MIGLATTKFLIACWFCLSRRDSFITHRAFCDALAEESARVNATSNMNSSLGGNVSYNIMGTSLGPNMATHFSSIFKPISSNDETSNQTSRGLSLWMGPGSQSHETMGIGSNLQEIHQLGSATNFSGSIYGNPLVSNSSPPTSNYHLSWVFGNKLSSNSSQELTSTSLPLMSNVVKDAGTEPVSVPSLYSSQHQPHQTSSANMSATALLQKAAQIGVTSTDPSFLGSLGLQCSNSQGQDENKFCGMYGSGSVLTSLGSETENSSAGELSQMHPAKRRHVQSEETTAGGQTRDFLGVGVQTICHPPSINGWI
ncbi:hypothetical protein L6164_018663 [Bauhinia variegata]|uniref:Uncharacterized protein n=1 Tax=Bauhinia variegata TaxID=167791 RepID=A0ACB9NBR0_BAUVA|nr:hypothetical protein L6164_018663 [Bauhinia variegata]